MPEDPYSYSPYQFQQHSPHPSLNFSSSDHSRLEYLPPSPPHSTFGPTSHALYEHRPEYRLEHARSHFLPPPAGGPIQTHTLTVPHRSNAWSLSFLTSLHLRPRHLHLRPKHLHLREQSRKRLAGMYLRTAHDQPGQARLECKLEHEHAPQTCFSPCTINHAHSDACYRQQTKVGGGVEPGCGNERHRHTVSCYPGHQGHKKNDWVLTLPGAVMRPAGQIRKWIRQRVVRASVPKSKVGAVGDLGPAPGRGVPEMHGGLPELRQIALGPEVYGHSVPVPVPLSPELRVPGYNTAASNLQLEPRLRLGYGLIRDKVKLSAEKGSPCELGGRGEPCNYRGFLEHLPGQPAAGLVPVPGPEGEPLSITKTKRFQRQLKEKPGYLLKYFMDLDI